MLRKKICIKQDSIPNSILSNATYITSSSPKIAYEYRKYGFNIIRYRDIMIITD
jgi:hypothetical protein